MPALSYAARPLAIFHIMRIQFLRAAIFSLCALGTVRAQQGVWVSGLTEPLKDVVLSANVAGMVTRRLVQEGDAVTNGQVLIELDKRLEELAVQRHKLVADQFKTNFDADRFVFTNSPNASIPAEEVAKAEVEYKVSLVDYQIAVEQLRKRLIRAPMDGYITDILVQNGEERRAQEPVLRMAETRRCYFISNVEPKVGWGLITGQTVQLQVDTGLGPVPVQGTITFVSPVVDPGSGLMRVKVLFSNSDGKLRPGVAGKMKVEGAIDGH